MSDNKSTTYYRAWQRYDRKWGPVQTSNPSTLQNYNEHIFKYGEEPDDMEKYIEELAAKDKNYSHYRRAVIRLCSQKEINAHTRKQASYRKQRANHINTIRIANTDPTFSLGIGYAMGAEEGSARNLKIVGDDLQHYSYTIMKRIAPRTFVLCPTYASANYTNQGAIGTAVAAISSVQGVEIFPSAMPGSDERYRWSSKDEYMNAAGAVQYALNTMRFAQMKWLNARKNKNSMLLMQKAMVEHWEKLKKKFPKHIKEHVSREMDIRIEAIDNREKIKKVNNAVFVQYKFQGKTVSASDVEVNSW